MVAMAKKGKKGGGGAVVQKERSSGGGGGGGGGEKATAYANETRRIILSVHKLRKVTEILPFTPHHCVSTGSRNVRAFSFSQTYTPSCTTRF